MSSNDLASRIRTAQQLDRALLADICVSAAKVFPDAPAHADVLDDPTDAIMQVITRCLPGWHIHLTGIASEPDGHWRASLRSSQIDEDDEVVGTAIGPTIPLVLARALWDVVGKSG
ncbi:hypothetical protein [Nioella nitratireducens]|uniref:hypothetical protein n=1 Tax=Nioella nitratireducens TaxID=1287720 RepID=UPI0008FD37E2|nr:hypothetical protein [Nioella nitratireducens]